jgi:hypothetical protein
MNFKSAYFLSHNGLGDNITNIGAVNFLLKYYDTIYFLCKDIYQENVKLFFINKNVIIVPFNSQDEYNDCYNIITNAQLDSNNDFFISGFHKSYVNSRITNNSLLNYKKNNKYIVSYDHIKSFYDENGLDTTIYVEYFNIVSNFDISDITDKIIFIHTEGSNRTIDLSDVINKYINNDSYIIICPNKNVYNENNINSYSNKSYNNNNNNTSSALKSDKSKCFSSASERIILLLKMEMKLS